MPRLIQPDLPTDVEMAVAFLGNRAQVEILRSLTANGPCTIGVLLSHVTMSRASLNKHLVMLENSGVVSGDPAEGQRQGRSVVYAVDARRVRFLAERCVAYIAGRD